MILRKFVDPGYFDFTSVYSREKHPFITGIYPGYWQICLKLRKCAIPKIHLCRSKYWPNALHVLNSSVR